MTSNMINYIHGVVRIKISGRMPEKFINLCITQNIYLWGIVTKNNTFIASMRLYDFFSIRPLVRMSGNQIEVIGHYGFPFIAKRIKRRKMLVIGGLLFLILLQYLSSYIWFIDIIGAKTIPYNSVHNIVYQNGLKPGMLKDKINTKMIENQILYNLPEVAWVGISFTGTHAVIEIVEKTLPKAEDKTPANVIAAKDGIITEIIALAGQSVVKKGDTIRKGELLIKGISNEVNLQDPALPPVGNIQPQPLRAQGIIKARVWYENYGEAELVTKTYERTGRQEIGVMLKVGSWEIPIKQFKTDDNTQFETQVLHKKLSWWRNHEFPVESIINTYYEVHAVHKELTMDEAKEAATIKALAALQSEIPENAQVVSRKIELIKTQEHNLVRVKVSVETIEDIGQNVNIQ